MFLEDLVELLKKSCKEVTVYRGPPGPDCIYLKDGMHTIVLTVYRFNAEVKI